MVSIPDLPKCDQPATARFEIWTPLDIPHGSLDGVAYSCDDHASDVAKAIQAAGYTPLRVSDPEPGCGRTCGYLVDFGDPIEVVAGAITSIDPMVPSDPEPRITHHIPEITVPPVVVPLPGADRRHPRWCNHGPICAGEQIHASDPHNATPDGSYMAIRAWLEQHWQPADAPVLVVFEVTHDGDPVEYSMVLDQARVVAFVLRGLLRRAGAL